MSGNAFPTSSSWPSNYQLRQGNHGDRPYLKSCFRAAYQELCALSRTAHLADTVDQLWSRETPLWLVHPLDEPTSAPVGCLWLGSAMEQQQGEAYTHLLLLYVAPQHRRQGLGTALMAQAESWARQRGDHHIGLHVFNDNQPALALYQKLGYSPQAAFLRKPLAPESNR